MCRTDPIVGGFILAVSSDRHHAAEHLGLWTRIAMAAVVSACYCLLWVGIALGVCMLTRRAATGAGALLGAWLVVVVLMPYHD